MENNKDQNPIDDLFSSELGGYEMKVEGNAWAKFEAAFPAADATETSAPQHEEKNNKGIAFWVNPSFYRAAAAILLVFSIGFYLIGNKTESPQEIAAVGPEIEIKATPEPAKPVVSQPENQPFTGASSPKEHKQNSKPSAAEPMAKPFVKATNSVAVDQDNGLSIPDEKVTVNPETTIKAPVETIAAIEKPTAPENESFTYQLELRPSLAAAEEPQILPKNAQAMENPLPDSGNTLMGRLSKMAPWNQINSNEIAYTRLARLVRPSMNGNDF